MNDHLDLKESLKWGLSIKPQVCAVGTTTGSAINLRQTGAEVLALVQVGAIATTGTATVKLQSSKNDNTADAWGAADAYADIASASVSVATADANSLLYIQSRVRAESYVKAVAVVTTDTVALSVLLSAIPTVAP